MNAKTETEELIRSWKQWEDRAQIRGWDFSPIRGLYEEGNDLPWNYAGLVRSYLREDFCLLDIDTGGGEFLLSLGHPFERTCATEGYPPNVKLCRETLLPLGIDFREMSDGTSMPFPDNYFDMIINRHGQYCVPELHRTLKKGGLYLTQQVGDQNDRELIDLLLPGTPPAFPGMNLTRQRELFEKNGFEILREGECFRPIRFCDVGALVWFAHIIPWEFPGFTVDRCLEGLLEAQKRLKERGAVEGRTHRYLIAARKK